MDFSPGVIEAARRLAKYSNSQPRDDHGRFGSGGGGSEAKPASLSTQSSESDKAMTERINASLAAGNKIECTPGQLPALMKSWETSETPVNLHLLSVQGPGNENIFAGTNLGIPRSEMPQVAGDSETIGKFGTLLGQAGVQAQLESIDPRSLHPTQSELDGRNASKIAESMLANGRQPSVLVVSKDDYILDGHHRWAGAAILSASGLGTLSRCRFCASTRTSGPSSVMQSSSTSRRASRTRPLVRR